LLKSIEPESNEPMSSRNPIATPSSRGPLGQYLWDLRQASGLSLREVEKWAGVSNAYVSQLETGKIVKPSPDVLHRLDETYASRLPRNARVLASFKRMMELAGHPTPKKDAAREGRLPTFGGEELTSEEEEELLKYLAFLRMRKGKS